MGLARRLAITSILMLGTTPVIAADLAVNSKIDAVSVYPDGATVTRFIDFDAPAGESTLVANDLPVGFDASSLRVDVRDAAGISISGIDLSDTLTDAPGPDAQAEKALRDLQDKREAIDGAGKALLAKQGLIGRFASSAAFDATKEGSNITALRNAWNAVGDDLVQVNEAIRQNGLQLRDVDEAIAKLVAQRDGRPQGKQRTQLRIAFTSDQPAKGRIAVSYLIGGASWTPLYDAKLDSGTGALEITRRAKVSQATGEDWSSVALTVSTAHATSGASAPELASKIVNFEQDDESLSGVSAGVQADRRAVTALPAPVAAPMQKMAGDALPRPGREVEATLDTAGFQSVWALPSRATILSGNATKSLRLASSTMTPDIVARTVPSLQETAYLEASFNNADDTPLFPGAVSIYRDGLYAGQAEMPLATKGEPVRLGFGADDRIKVDRVVTRKVEADTGIFHPTTSESRAYKISLRNGRPTAIKISVEEALPVAENKDIKVETLPQMTAVNAKDVENRRGVQVWTYDLAPGATKDINFGYKVSWPADQRINLQ